MCFFLFGILKASVGPLLYIDELKSEWGETAYLVIQMLGTHGFGQGALLALAWIRPSATSGGAAVRSRSGSRSWPSSRPSA